MVVTNQPDRISRANLILVSDESELRDSIERILRTADEEYEVFCAPDVSSALSIMSSRPMDVFIIDMAMSGDGEMSLLTKVKRRWPATIRIALSETVEVPLAMMAVRRKLLSGYLAKPCEEKELLLLIKTALDRKKREKARWLLEKRAASLERSVLLTSDGEPVDIDDVPM